MSEFGSQHKKYYQELKLLIDNYEQELLNDNLRSKVIYLTQVLKNFRNLGKSIIDDENDLSARDRILKYFLKFPGVIINGDELFIVSGIQEYARRVRGLRVQFGWSILSGKTYSEIAHDTSSEYEPESIATPNNVCPDDYIMISTRQDKEAAYRWSTANDLRRRNLSATDKLLEYLKLHVGREISGEELRYVSGNKSEWARRVRELRTEQGWPIVTKYTGRPDLPIGTYLLETLEQSQVHDRTIADKLRKGVLERDQYSCVECGWNQQMWEKSNPRHLELHHIKTHASGGANIEENLQTLCNRCHDRLHKK